MRSYLVGHFRGQLALGRTFWLNGLLAFTEVAIFNAVSTRLATRVGEPGLIGFASLLNLVLASVWYVAGVLRSAGNSQGSLWGTLARFSMLVGLIATLAGSAHYV